MQDVSTVLTTLEDDGLVVVAAIVACQSRGGQFLTRY